MSDRLKLLDELVPQYALNKKELDSYKKLCDEENKSIKSIMQDLTLQHYTAGGYKVTKTVQKRDRLNEDMLLSLFTSVPKLIKVAENCNLVKTKQYVDMDALEKAIYDDKFTIDELLELNAAKESKEVVTLRLSKVKEKADVD